MGFPSSLVKDFRDAFIEDLDAGQRAALLSWLAFTVTFGAVRGITYSIKAGKGPFGNLSVGGEHLHHYMWGIGLVSGVGGVAVHGEDSRRRHPVVAISYGAGLALIVDEFALLLDLKDVYWAKQGRISVDLGVGASSLAGTYFAALRPGRRPGARRATETSWPASEVAVVRKRPDDHSDRSLLVARGRRRPDDEVNVWIVGDDDEVIVIDPGTDPAGVLDVVGDREVLAVICTHGHADHVAAAIELAERDEAPVALHPKDRMLWREAHPGDDADIEMEDGGIFEVADVRLEVIHAPGHTDGSVCLYCEDLGVVFTGHVLAAGGPVPHDGEFPDFAGQLTAIGEHLLTLPSDTRVLPGHGPETTIAAAEKKFDSWVSAGPVVTSPSGSAD